MLHYDENIFQEFRAKAITDVANLIVGRTYYSNYSNPDKFVIKELITNKEDRVRRGMVAPTSDGDLINWIVTEEDKIFSLRDSNIGASYNPWLIFDDEAVARECETKLVFSYGPSYDFDDWVDDDRDDNEAA